MISLERSLATAIHYLSDFVYPQLSWLVSKEINRQEADRALSTLSDKVKLGTLRATLIAQDAADGDSTLVTLNAGVKEDPI